MFCYSLLILTHSPLPFVSHTEDVKACRNDEAEEYDEDEFEEEDDDFDYSVGLSRMSINEDDDVTIDTRRSIGKSVSFSVKSGATNLKKYSRKTVSGVAVGHNKGSVGIALALPYVIDYWHDKSPRQRASIQIQMLSGDAMQLQRVSYRVSTSCDEFVVSLPKSRFMGCPKAAFETYVLSNTNNDDKEKHKRILEYHPKTAARRLQLNAINKGGNVMELRIKLQHKFSLDFASVASNDPYFYGDKFVTYPDGSTHLIVELVSDEDKHSSPNKAAAPIFHVPGSVSVPSVGGDDNMSFHSHMDMSVGSRRSMKSTRTSNTSHSHRSHRSARSVPIINAASPAVASRASKYRKNEYGERAAAAREGPVETVSDEHSL